MSSGPVLAALGLGRRVDSRVDGLDDRRGVTRPGCLNESPSA